MRDGTACGENGFYDVWFWLWFLHSSSSRNSLPVRTRSRSASLVILPACHHYSRARSKQTCRWWARRRESRATRDRRRNRVLDSVLLRARCTPAYRRTSTSCVLRDQCSSQNRNRPTAIELYPPVLCKTFSRFYFSQKRAFNRLKCSGIRRLHFKLFNATQV